MRPIFGTQSGTKGRTSHVRYCRDHSERTRHARSTRQHPVRSPKARRRRGATVPASVDDVTTREQAEATLIKAGALQKAIFNSANFSSIATDATGVIQIFNVGAARMLGFTAAEVTNKV